MLEYESPSSDEASADDETACNAGEIPSLEREANILLGRVSRFGRSIRFNSRILLSKFFFIFLVMGLWDFRHLLFFYAFVNIAIRFFDTDLSLRFSVTEVKQKEVNGSILIEKIITHRKGPFNDFKYMKIMHM